MSGQGPVPCGSGRAGERGSAGGCAGGAWGCGSGRAALGPPGPALSPHSGCGGTGRTCTRQGATTDDWAGAPERHS